MASLLKQQRQIRTKPNQLHQDQLQTAKSVTEFEEFRQAFPSALNLDLPSREIRVRC
ncbi:MAG: hypothetical protein JWM11_1699 [Planctomycetaceae bacterium]|nr:hypothetical protein [Planctomycetaceae bacterium]